MHKLFVVLALSLSLATPMGTPATARPVLQVTKRFPPRMLFNTMRVYAQYGSTTASGSGFAVDLSRYGLKGRRYVLTAGHVVLSKMGRPAIKIRVEQRIEGPRLMLNIWIHATIMAYHKTYDIALLKLDRELPSVCKLASGDNIKIGDPLIAIGHPAGSAATPSFGFLTAKQVNILGSKRLNNYAQWQASMTIFYGNSGGPVWDAVREEIVGIAVAGLNSGGHLAPNITFFVPITTIDKFLRSQAVNKANKRIKIK